MTEQLIFPEIDYDKVLQVRGMDITVVTTAKSDDEGRALLMALGFPFAGTRGGSAGEREGLSDMAKTGVGQQAAASSRSSGCAATRVAAGAAGPRAVFSKLLLCRICFRELAHAGRASRGDESVMVSTKSRKRKFSSNISDPVADLLTRIRNANLAYKDELDRADLEAGRVHPGDPAAARATSTAFDREGEGVEQAFRIRLKYGKRTRAHDHRASSAISQARAAASTRSATSCRGCWAAWASRSCPRRRAS